MSSAVQGLPLKAKVGEIKKEETTETQPSETKPSVAPLSPTAEIKANVAFIERGVSTLEPRFTHRVLRTLTSLRKKLNWKVLRDAIEGVYPAGESSSRSNLRSAKSKLT